MSRIWLGVLGSLALLAAGCGGGSSTTSAFAAATTVATSTTSAPTTTSPSTTGAPATTTTEPATTTTVKLEISIDGSDDFASHTHAALALLEDEVAMLYEQVLTYIDTIKSVSAGSGMHVETKTFDVGNETAYAPGWESPDQVLWYAGAIVHDSCHSRLYSTGQPHRGKEAELACLEDQLSALQVIDDAGVFVTYVGGLIEGADDPENQYWNDPNRHW